MFPFKQTAAEIDGYRDYREQEEICAAAQSDVISRDNRINGNLEYDAHISRKDMFKAAQDIAECVDDNAENIKYHQRHYACEPEKDYERSMDSAHNANRKREGVFNKESKPFPEISPGKAFGLLSFRSIHAISVP